MQLIDLTGKRFGRLYVIKRDKDFVQESGRKRAAWLCECDCGTIKSVLGDNLKSGKVVTCGCYARENTSKNNSTHHESKSHLYAVWCGMKARCNNQNNTYYSRYGGRGISVCDEWQNNYNAFRDWMLDNGYSDSGHDKTIDRINNDLGYSPDNCRVVDAKSQANNRSSCRLFTYKGKTQNITQWADEFGIEFKKLHYRLSHGWDIERALITP